MCVSCGLPSSGSSCSMCYGDLGYGTDGYYEAWAREVQEREEAERQLEAAMDAVQEEESTDAQS